MRPLVVAPLLALLSLSVTAAAETEATVKGVDAKANAVTLTIAGKDKTYPVSPDAAVVTVSRVPGKNGKVSDKVTPVAGGLGGVAPGTKVTVLIEPADGKDVVAAVKIADGKAAAAAPAPKKKKKKT